MQQVMSELHIGVHIGLEGEMDAGGQDESVRDKERAQEYMGLEIEMEHASTVSSRRGICSARYVGSVEWGVLCPGCGSVGMAVAHGPSYSTRGRARIFEGFNASGFFFFFLRPMVMDHLRKFPDRLLSQAHRVPDLLARKETVSPDGNCLLACVWESYRGYSQDGLYPFGCRLLDLGHWQILTVS